MYTSADYEKLDAAIDKISLELKNELFANSKEVKQNIWKERSESHNFSLLFELQYLRERVFDTAGVTQKHKNKEESRKYLDRLKTEQEQRRQQAEQDKRQEDMKQQNLLERIEN